MAKGKGAIQGWITKNGIHIPIYSHYSVRGGEEPKAKGSKFKRKKRPEEFDKDIRETEGGKFMAQYSSDQGRKKGVKDIEKPFETREGARKFLAEENGEYEDAYPKNKSTKIKRGMTNEELDTANRELDAKDAEADMEKYEAEHPMKKGKKDKYANRDWNKDVDDAKRYGYSEQSEEGKKPVTKAEEQGKTIEVNGRKINVKPGENNSQAIYRQAMEDQGKPVDKQFYNELVADPKRKSFTRDELDGRPASLVSDRNVSNTQMLERELERHPNDEHTAEIKQRLERSKAYDRDHTSEQASSKSEFGKQTNDDISNYRQKFLSHRSDQELKELQTNLNKKVPGVPTSPSDMVASAAVEQELASRRQTSSNPTIHETRLQRQIVNEKAGLKSDRNQNFKTAYQNKESSTSKVNPDWGTDITDSVLANGFNYDTVKRGDTVTYVDSKGNTFSTTYGMRPDKFTISNERDASGSRRVSSVSDTEWSRSDGTISNNAGHHYMTPQELAQKGIKVYYSKGSTSKSQDSLSASMNERSRIRGELYAKDKAMKAAMPTTVSGLRSAYADATGSMKSKIAAELRRKGYSLVGGKWVKGRKE